MLQFFKIDTLTALLSFIMDTKKDPPTSQSNEPNNEDKKSDPVASETCFMCRNPMTGATMDELSTVVTKVMLNK